MGIAKFVIGIISIVVFSLIIFQSFDAGLLNMLEVNGDYASGHAGIFLAFSMLVAGIIGIVAHKSESAAVVAGAFYMVAAFIGFVYFRILSDLIVWSVVALVFGVIFIAGSMKKYEDKSPEKFQITNNFF